MSPTAAASNGAPFRATPARGAATAPSAASRRSRTPEPPAPPAPLLVATDGRDAATPALKVAAALADRLSERLAARAAAAQRNGGTGVGARPAAAVVVPQALAVLEPLPTHGAELAAGVLDAIELDRAAVTRDAMRRQMRAAVDAAWPAQVAFGQPARTIAQVAAERHARLVLLGIGRHGLGDRLFGTETALQVLRSGSTPVLGVGPLADGCVRRAVVAIDFSPASARAAELALELLDAGGTLSLVHVKSRLEGSQPVWEAWDAGYGRRVTELLQRLVATLRAGPPSGAEGGPESVRRDVTIGTAVLVGDPADELLEHAERVGADLVAVGAHGGGLVERLFVGSVATAVLRRTSGRLPGCSVLAVPEPPPAEAQRLERQLLGTTEALDPAEWRLALEGFTLRNGGRRVVLEIDDPTLGAQAALRGYALLGATYDQRDGRAELMFGDAADRTRHLTRVIRDVASLAVLTTAEGRDTALRIEHGAGQTLVTFCG